jgi:archaellum component FlaG (FlaF/FlaG flagellin family)
MAPLNLESMILSALLRFAVALLVASAHAGVQSAITASLSNSLRTNWLPAIVKLL